MRVFEADCVGDVVKVEGIVISNAVILSGGDGESQGILLVQESNAYYIASNRNDLNTTLTKIISIDGKIADSLTQIGASLTAIGAGMNGSLTAPPPTLGAQVAVINSNVAVIQAAVVELNTLKGALI